MEKILKMRDRCCGNSRRIPMLLFSNIALIDFFVILVAAKPTAVVRTTGGPVRGEILTSVNSVNYAAFKGIPYAKPPLGYLRFKPPVPNDPWTEILNATVEGNDCMQPDAKRGGIVGSEDCLYINVHTPVTDLKKTPANLKPVMVWIYGGGFTTGTSSSEEYHPDYLLEKGVVYVAFNYRLGPLGFLNLQHPNATGNAGLKDQVLALKWVKANIKKFGGNPNNVTIFGQSAGAVSVGYHILSDASKGLFQAAISMSGVPLNIWAFYTPAKALFRARQLGAFLGSIAITFSKETLLRTLINARAVEIIKAATRVFWGILPFVPTLEDKRIATDAFLTKCSVDKYNTGNFTKVPQILGFTDRETVTFAAEIGNPGLELIVNVTSDATIVAQIDQTQQFLAARNEKPVYYYHISFHTNRSLHNINFNSTLLGAGHADDLAYVFYYPKANYSTDPRDPTRRTIDRVTTMWTNFAKYGTPTPDWVNDDVVGVTWPNSGPRGRSLDIGTELKVGLRPVSEDTELIEVANFLVLRSLNGCHRESQRFRRKQS